VYHYELQEAMVKSLYPVARVHMYCAPCRCAIRTALLLCASQSSNVISYTTRIDDRIPASCCLGLQKLERLESLLNTIREYDAGMLVGETQIITDLLRHIDRVWLEKRIYHFEEEISYQDTQKPDRLCVEGLLRDETCRENTYSVHIGELVQCAWITQMTPFPWSPRMPREYEIFGFDSVRHAKEFRKTYLGTFAGPAHGTRIMGSKELQSQSTTLARARDMADPGLDSIPENTLANLQTRDHRHQNSISIQANAVGLEREGEHDRTDNDSAVERAESIRSMPQSGDSHDEDGPSFLPKRRKRSI
jgi:hypothetical protein